MDILLFIKRYEALLKEKRIPKMQFYRECGISDAAVSQWRKGKTIPTMKSVQQIAQYLETTSEYLMYGNGQKEKPITVSDDELSLDEQEAIRLWRAASPERRQALLALLKGE